MRIPKKPKKLRRPLPKAPWLDEDDTELDRCRHGRFLRFNISYDVHRTLCKDWKG